MATFESLLPDVLAEADGCPRELALRELRYAVRRFCSMTHIWKESGGTISPVEGLTEYQIELPPRADLVAITSLLEYATVRLPDTVVFDTAPTQEIAISVAVQPAMDATTFPDMLLQWREALAAGALGRLMMMPGKPWAVPEMTSYHGSTFNRGVSDAKGRSAKNFTATPLTIQPRHFA